MSAGWAPWSAEKVIRIGANSRTQNLPIRRDLNPTQRASGTRGEVTRWSRFLSRRRRAARGASGWREGSWKLPPSKQTNA